MEDHGFLVVVGKEAKMSQMVYIYSANERFGGITCGWLCPRTVDSTGHVRGAST